MDNVIVIPVRWHDGYLEKFEATEVRFGCDLLWMKLTNGERRAIPLRAVRWFDPGENHGRLLGEEVITTTTTIETEVGLRQFLTDLFESENMSPEEQEKVMQMPVKDFCDMVEKMLNPEAESAHQVEQYNPIPPGIPKMQFLTNLATYACPVCNQKGGLKLVDGHLKCSICAYDFGDIDILNIMRYPEE
jgi:hypothetical protein